MLRVSRENWNERRQRIGRLTECGTRTSLAYEGECHEHHQCNDENGCERKREDENVFLLQEEVHPARWRWQSC